MKVVGSFVLAALAVLAVLFGLEVFGLVTIAYYVWHIVGGVLATLTFWLLLVAVLEPR